MTTNTNPSRTTARFFASTTPNAEGLYTISDRVDPLRVYVVAMIKGRAEARRVAAVLNSHADLLAEPYDVPAAKPLNLRDTKKAAKASKKADAAKVAKATADDAEPVVRTSHADCGHASTKMARAICRRDRSKADA